VPCADENVCFSHAVPGEVELKLCETRRNWIAIGYESEKEGIRYVYKAKRGPG